MIKTGRIEPGKTPSSVSGKPCDKVRDEEPVRGREKPVMRKLARLMGKKESDNQ
jgi:hypothetical protein